MYVATYDLTIQVKHSLHIKFMLGEKVRKNGEVVSRYALLLGCLQFLKSQYLDKTQVATAKAKMTSVQSQFKNHSS